MTKRREDRTPSPRSITLAFKNFAMDASEEELDEALRSAGIDPVALERQADAAIGSALKTIRNSNVREMKEVAKTNVSQVALHKGLSALIRLLRRKNGLSEEALAKAADVDVKEIHRIECDQFYEPGLRTIYQLEEYFKLPERSLALISGTMKKQSEDFKEEVLKFAAHSDQIGKLSREELKLVSEFVKYLANEAKKRS